jgi:hypothetical protein
MAFYDSQKGSLRSIAGADIKHGQSIANDIPLPLSLRRELEQVDKFPRNRIANAPWSSDPFCKYVGLAKGWGESPVLINRLVIDANT